MSKTKALTPTQRAILLKMKHGEWIATQRRADRVKPATVLLAPGGYLLRRLDYRTFKTLLDLGHIALYDKSTLSIGHRIRRDHRTYYKITDTGRAVVADGKGFSLLSKNAPPSSHADPWQSVEDYGSRPA